MDDDQKKYSLSRFWMYIFTPLLLLTVALFIIMVFRLSANQTFKGSYTTAATPSAPPATFSTFVKP